MTSPNTSPIEPTLWQSIAAEVGREPALIPDRDVSFSIATENYVEPMTSLYKSAFDRGDYFASRYKNPDNEVFNPDWLAQDLQDTSHIRFVFTDHRLRLLGATAFFHDYNSAASPLMTSDETQIDHIGRGRRIMDNFFKRVVPTIESAGVGLATDFVLSPESKGLRRTLQAELGMTAIGIHPHALRHRTLGVTRSEISAVKYTALTPKQVSILPNFEPIYRIVQAQLPDLPEPDIVDLGQRHHRPALGGEAEQTMQIDAADPQAQSKAIQDGWQPVEFDPDSNLFKVAKFPTQKPNLDFILTIEDIAANKRLVEYFNNTLYGRNQPNKQEEKNHEPHGEH